MFLRCRLPGPFLDTLSSTLTLVLEALKFFGQLSPTALLCNTLVNLILPSSAILS